MHILFIFYMTQPTQPGPKIHILNISNFSVHLEAWVAFQSFQKVPVMARNLFKHCMDTLYGIFSF